MTATDSLREEIRSLLRTHPDLRKLDKPRIHDADTEYAERYSFGEARGIVHEARPKTQQNLWVQADAIRLDRLVDIRHDPKYRDPKQGRNSNLDPSFAREEPLIKFMPATAWEAARIIMEAVGDGHTDD